MQAFPKTLIPNKEWIIKDDDSKIGTIAKNKKGYAFLKKGQILNFKNLDEVVQTLGVTLPEGKKTKVENETDVHYIYGYPCSNKPYGPVYNVKKKLPLFSKSNKSKSLYCAGHYIIKFRKGWVKSYCPKLITLERYPYHGPYKTELEMRSALNTINKL